MSPADFQDEFVSYLSSPQLPNMPTRTLAALAIYRNTVAKGLIDALAANYPTVLKLVGNEWFESAAITFAHLHAPETPILAEYGESFPAFLAEFPPAVDLLYLSDVARIDRLWMESYLAADAASLPASILQGLSGDQLMSARLQLHPATRLQSLKNSAVTIWLHNQIEKAGELSVDNSDEDALITRTANGVSVMILCVIEYRFLLEIQKGATLGEAAMTALGINPEFPLAATLAKLIGAGCFVDATFT